MSIKCYIVIMITLNDISSSRGTIVKEKICSILSNVCLKTIANYKEMGNYQGRIKIKAKFSVRQGQDDK